MTSKKVSRILNVTRTNPTKMPQATPLGSAGYDNARDDIEKVKKLREGSVVKSPTRDYDIANKAYVDSNDFWQRVGAILSPKTAGDEVHMPDNDAILFGAGGLTGALGADAKLFSDGTNFGIQIESANGILKNPIIEFTTYDITRGLFGINIPIIDLKQGGISFVLRILDVDGMNDPTIILHAKDYISSANTDTFHLKHKTNTNRIEFTTNNADLDYIFAPAGVDSWKIDGATGDLDGYANNFKTTGNVSALTADFGDGGTTNYAQFAADGELKLHGMARVKKEFGVILTDFNPGASGPTKALHGVYPTFEFTIGDDMHTSFELPTDWATGTDITVEVYWAINEAYATNNGEVRWSAGWRAVAVGELIIGGSAGTMDFGDVNIPATANTVVKTESTISGASLSMDDLIAFNGARVALVAGSNPTAEPYIVAIRVKYTADKLGEAT